MLQAFIAAYLSFLMIRGKLNKEPNPGGKGGIISNTLNS
jgi:hypothetical protein